MTMIGQWTNRGRLIAELEGLSNEELYSVFADNRMTRALDDAMCDDCKMRHGHCVATGDEEPCPFTMEDAYRVGKMCYGSIMRPPATVPHETRRGDLRIARTSFTPGIQS